MTGVNFRFGSIFTVAVTPDSGRSSSPPESGPGQGPGRVESGPFSQ